MGLLDQEKWGLGVSSAFIQAGGDNLYTFIGVYGQVLTWINLDLADELTHPPFPQGKRLHTWNGGGPISLDIIPL